MYFNYKQKPMISRMDDIIGFYVCLFFNGSLEIEVHSQVTAELSGFELVRRAAFT